MGGAWVGGRWEAKGGFFHNYIRTKKQLLCAHESIYSV